MSEFSEYKRDAIVALSLAYGERLDEASVRDLFHRAASVARAAAAKLKKKAKRAAKKALSRIGIGKEEPQKASPSAKKAEPAAKKRPETPPKRAKSATSRAPRSPKRRQTPQKRVDFNTDKPLGRSTMYKHMSVAIYRNLRKRGNTKYGRIPNAALTIAGSQMVRHGYAERRKGGGVESWTEPIRLTGKGKRRSRLHAKEPARVLRRKERSFRELVRRAGLTKAVRKPVR